jgi:ABC-type multidrug transport system ATPase subunit
VSIQPLTDLTGTSREATYLQTMSGTSWYGKCRSSFTQPESLRSAIELKIKDWAYEELGTSQPSIKHAQVNKFSFLSIEIVTGEYVALMGASGSGKSTLMHLLGCLDTPSSGRYRLEGREVSQLSRAEQARIRGKRIGFIFQNFNLLGRHTALENY